MRRLKLLGPIGVTGLTSAAIFALAFFGSDGPSAIRSSGSHGGDSSATDAGIGRARHLGEPDTVRDQAGLDEALLDEAALDEEEPQHPEVLRLEALLCDRLAREVCAARGACSCRPADDEEPCEDHERGACRSWLECAAFAAVDEAVVVDEARLAACLQSIRADLASCDAWRIPQVCHELLVEPVDVGEPCTGEREGCRGGHCGEDRCEALPGRGERCEWMCAPGLVCTDAMRCEREADARSECGSAWDCPPRLACVDGACARPRGVGARCTEEDACARGMRCEVERCVRAERCRADGGCGRLSRCAGPVVDRCVETGRWPLAAIGAECALSGECGRGAVCASGRCAGAPSAGQECVDGRCASDAFCLRGHCVGREAARSGSSCELYAQDSCGPGFACVWSTLTDGGAGGRCQPAAARDEPCPTGACELGLRCSPVVEDGRCEPIFCGPESIWTCDLD